MQRRDAIKSGRALVVYRLIDGGKCWYEGNRKLCWNDRRMYPRKSFPTETLQE
jgi:hypothetical protein